MNDADRDQLQKRLRRVAGQVGGIQRMVDEDRYCVDILTQIAAARAALDRVGVELLTSHVRHCVGDRLAQDAPRDNAMPSSRAHPEASARTREELLEEVATAVGRFLR